MKHTLTLLVLALFAFSAQAYDSKMYHVNFEIKKISPMCPRSIPNGATCMGLGSIVHVEAQLNGCFDKIAFVDFRTVENDGKVTIFATGVAKSDRRSISSYCSGLPVHKATIPVNQITNNIELINIQINQ